MYGSGKTRRLFKKALSHPPTRRLPRHTPFPYQGHSEPFIRSLWALSFSPHADASRGFKSDARTPPGERRVPGQRGSLGSLRAGG